MNPGFRPLCSSLGLVRALLIAIMVLAANQACIQREFKEPRSDESPAPHSTARISEAPEIAELRPGESPRRNLSSGQAHEYRVRLSAGDFVHIVVDQLGVDVVATLFAPDGASVIRMDRPVAGFGPEPLMALADETGEFTVRVEAGGKDISGLYSISLIELAPAREKDVARARAAAFFAAGGAQRREGEFRGAIKGYREASAIWEELNERSWQAESLARIGDAHARLGLWEEAIGFHEQAAAIYQEEGDAQLEAMTLHSLGLNHFYLTNLERATEYYKSALPLRREAGDRYGEAITHHALAQVYQRQDEVQLALDSYSRALDLLEAPKQRARSVHNLGVLYLSLGQVENARASFLEAEKILTDVGDRRRLATTLNQLGELHRRTGALDSAFDYFQRSFELRQELKDHRGQATSLANIGLVYQARDELESALTHLSRAQEILEELRRTREEARVWLNLGSLHLDRKQLSEATAAFEASRELYEKVGDPSGIAESLLGTARTERVLGKPQDALDSSEKALGIFESIRPKAVSYNLRSSFFETVQEHFEFHIDLLMQLHWLEPQKGHAASALVVSERARARSLLDLLTEAGVQIRVGSDSELLDRERALQGRLNALEKLRLQLRNDPRQRLDQVRKIENTIRRVLQDLEGIRGEILHRHPQYSGLIQGDVLDLDEIQRSVLGEQPLLLQYRLGEQRSFLWVLTNQSLDSFELSGRAEIERLSLEAHRLLTRSHRREAREATQDALCQLSRQLLGPVADQLDERPLVIVSDGAVQFIPFAALPEPGQLNRCSDAPPMIAKREISYLPSASALAILRREISEREETHRSIAVIGDPVFSKQDQRFEGTPLASQASEGPKAGNFQRLPFSRQEAEAILNIAGDSASFSALGFDANKEMVASGKLSDFRIVHFATHAEINTEHPELSGIILSTLDREGRPIDGHLRAHEIYNLQLPCELVVLSACQTALGKVVRGEGFQNLTRGFMYAGAARAMVSLWSVSDASTSVLMEEFYRGLFVHGLPPPAALRAAQLSMWQSKHQSAPHHWAGFMIQGEWQ